MPAVKTRRKVKRSRSPASMRRRSAAANNAPRRRPLATSNKQCDEDDIWSKLVSIFNDSQYVNKLEESVVKMTDLYSSSDFDIFERLFMKALRRLLQSDHTNYLKQACQFLCKLLKQLCSQHDERLVRSCLEVADHYMQISNEECRMNSVFLVSKFLAQVDELDECICDTLKSTLAKRIRDKKVSIRSHAVLAASKFQDNQMIRDAFEFHFRCDPELSVRKALIQTMDTAVFSCDFLVDATQDCYDSIRTAAYQRLAKVLPSELTPDQLHRVLHNGLFERDRSVSYVFKANMMAFWLTKLYDGTDLVHLLKSLDVINNTDDINKLLDQMHCHNLEKAVQLEDDDTATKLHHIVLSFQDRWLNEKRLPSVEQLDERVVVVWLSLINFCKSNEVIIKTTKNPASQQSNKNPDPNESIESVIDSQNNYDDQAALYELLMPDLIHLVEYLKKYVRHVYKTLSGQKDCQKHEFIYQNLMKFMSTYQIGDDSELRVVQDVLAVIMKENLLTSKFSNYIPPIIKCLKLWVFPSNPNLLVSYIAELINNIRSHLEDEQRQDHDVDDDEDEITAFKDHISELLECLQMYYACLENVNLTEVPPIMKNHLNHLSYEALDAFKDNTRVRVWIAACNGITAFMDEKFAQLSSTMTLLMASCQDKSSLEIQTMGYKALVDIMIQHDDVDVPRNRLQNFLSLSLRDYGKYDPKAMTNEEMNFVTTLVRGTAKLYYFRKLSSPDALAHLVLWWYHPRTHPKIRQYIGIFLPLFVKQSSKQRKLASADEDEKEQNWLEELLSNLFVTCVEYLHSYILGPGLNVMDESDMISLINFLCNLVPTPFHPKVIEAVDDRIDELTDRDSGSDLAKYLKRSKKNLLDLRTQPIDSLEPKIEPLVVGDPQNLFD